jgi:predicted metalloprotease
MRWKGRRQSENIEDRRGAAPMIAGGGIVTIIIALAVYFLGGDPTALKELTQSQSTPPASQGPNDEGREFVGVVLGDTEEVWTALFERMGRLYEKPRLVLFTGQVQSACGFASDATGPFYCPPDKSVYIDLSFFDLLKSRFGAPGEFARAYVIAHEVGHHVQNLLGTMDHVQRQRGRISEREYNQLSVRLELQADFYAGVWAHHAKDMASLTEQDIRDAMKAANAIGDDTLQKQAQGYVVPDSFTHGTSEQRVSWFMKGFQSGNPNNGDTFTARTL